MDRTRSGAAGCDDRGTSRSEYQPETTPPAAHDRRGRLGDGPSVGGFRCSGRSSALSSSRWTRASLVVLTLLALIVAPGTIFAVAAEPGSDLEPVRALRRLAQTPSGGGVEYLQRAKLTASDGAAQDEFGKSVSTDGDTMVIGAWQDDWSQSDDGSAYVFTRDTPGDLASNWTQVAKLTAYDHFYGDNFGRSVSIDGDTVVIGAHGDDDKGSASGSAYVFTRDTAGDLISGWTQVEPKLTADDGAAGDQFGISVSIDGDTMVIGANKDDHNGTDSGSAYVFTRDVAGDLASGWTQIEPKLSADDAAAFDRFGISVSIDGDTVVIGAYLDDNYKGSAYVFTRVTAGDLTSGWTQVAKLTADNGGASDWFGESVAISGDTVVIGANTVGSAYVFTRDTAGDLASGWTQVESKLTADDGSWGLYFGSSVSIDGDTVVIGAKGDDHKGSSSGRGSAYVFTLPSPCDASSPPANGAIGECTSSVASGSSCTPICDSSYALSGTRSCTDGTLTDTAVCNLNPCDAAAAIANGALNDCTSTLAHGSSCTPDCNTGYTLSGTRSCSAGTLTNTAVCNPNDCTASPDNPNKNGDDGVLYCINNGTVSGTTGACLCSGCKEGYGGASCETAGACSASSDSSKNGTDGAFYCINGGTISGSAGSCACTCKPGYEGSNCQTINCTTSQYFDGSACQACPTYSSSTGGTATSCTCAANTYAAKSGNSWTCANCTDGGTKAAGSVVPGTGSGEKQGDVCPAPSSSDKAKETKEKAETTRDTMLDGVTDAKLKKKAKLLADAAISGKKVRKMSAKLTASDADTACSDYYTKAGLSSSLGACIATAASRRRSLAAMTYDVSVFFSEAEVDDSTLTAAENSLKAEGVTGVETGGPIDPIAELGTIAGVDSSTLETFKTEAAAAAATMPPSPPPPPISPPPPGPPVPNLVQDDDDHAANTRSLVPLLVISTLHILFS